MRRSPRADTERTQKQDNGQWTATLDKEAMGDWATALAPDVGPVEDGTDTATS